MPGAIYTPSKVARADLLRFSCAAIACDRILASDAALRVSDEEFHILQQQVDTFNQLVSPNHDMMKVHSAYLESEPTTLVQICLETLKWREHVPTLAKLSTSASVPQQPSSKAQHFFFLAQDAETSASKSIIKSNVYKVIWSMISLGGVTKV